MRITCMQSGRVDNTSTENDQKAPEMRTVELTDRIPGVWKEIVSIALS